ncbi:MAG: sigma-70 family RNA polymerase sigma factor [Chitinophagales bacterium]
MKKQAFEQLKKSVQQGDTSPLSLVVKAVAPKCIRQLQLKFGCSVAEAKDIFSDAFIKFHDLLVANKINHGNISAYIFAICRSIYIDKHSKKRNLTKRKEVLIDHQEEMTAQQLFRKEDAQNDLVFNPLIKEEEEQEQLKQQKNEMEIIVKALKLMHPRCRQLLTLAIMHKMRYAEIVEIMGFANTQTVKSAKYNCLKKLKDIIKNTDK